MFDFAQGFPSQPTQPTSGPLNYQAEKSIQVRGFGDMGWNPINMVGGIINQAVGDDTVRVLDASGLRDGINWTHGELRKVADNREYGNLEYFINTLNNGKQNDAAVGLGYALEASQAMLLRQILGNNPLEPVMFAPSEITPEIMAAEEQELKGLLSTDNVPEENQKRVQEISNKKAYVESKTQADKNLGFNWWDWYKQTNVFNAASTLGVNVLGDKDVVDAVSEYDPNFKSAEWFDQFAADPIVKQGLLEHGITADTVAESPNADQAFMTISHIMYQSNTQKRMGTYKPTNYDFAKNMGSGLVSFMVDTPTGATIITGAAITAVASAFSPANFAAVGAAALGEAAVLGESAVATSSTMAFLNGAKTLGETLYKLPLGMAPHWMEGSTLVSMTAANIASGAIQGTIGSYNQQAHEISFGAATMYMNPNTRREMNLSDAVIEGLYSGVEMGVLFGLGGGLLRSVKGMTDNGFKGLIIDPVTGRRNRLDRSFTFQDTPLGNTLQMLGIKDYERSLIDLKPVDVVRNEAILEKTDPTPDRLAAETEGYADRAEAREALKHPEAAEATPEDVGTRRYESETTEQYINRVAPSRTIRNLPELVTEVARRTQVEGGRMITSSEEYHQMTPQDQARTLIRTQAVLEAAKKAEEKAVGLPKERERVFEQLEASRKEALRRLGKTLTPLEFKRLKAEFKGEKPKAKGGLPELLAVAGDKTKPIAERKANAEEAAGQILETARAAAKNPAKMKIIKSKVPQEVLDKVDAIAAEEALTGRVSAETAEEVKRSLLNADEPFTSTLSKRIEQAVKVTRLSPDRVARINAIKEDHTRFVSLVKGNRGRAFALYNHINEGVISGILTPEDRILILASVSHLNFDLKGFEMEYKYANMNDVNVAGEYNSRTRVLTLNTKCTPDKKAHTVLHEIGHALFSNDMYGEVYLENLKLYNSMRSGTPLSTDGIKLIDPLTTNLDKYHLQNVEESFVQLFSNVLLAETSQAMTTVESTVVRKTLAFIEKAILNATIALDESKYYERANSIIKALTEVDNKVIRQSVSVSSLLRAIAQAETTRPKNAAQFNFEILKSLRYRHPEVEISTIKNTFTDAEYKMLFKQVNDPTSLAAFAITRENGKPIVDEMGRFTVHAPKFFEAYSEYKKAQYNSAATRVAYMLRSMSYKLLVGMTKEEREKFLTYEIFDINATQKEGSPYANALGYNLAATYEDNHLASMNLNGGNYATDYLITTAESFVELLQEDGMSDAAPSALTLPAAEREALIRRIQEDPYMSKPIMEQLREHFDKAGLTQYYQKAFHKMQKDLILRMYEEGVFNIDNPDIRRNINPEVSKKNDMLGILQRFIGDKNSFNTMPLDFLLRDVLGLEETLVVKYMNLGKANPFKALQALQIAVSKNLIEHDGSNWVLKLEQVSASEKVEPTIVSQTKANKLSAGVKLVTTKTLNVKLMEFYDNAESILREAKSKISIDTFRDVLGEFQTYGTDKRNSLIKKLEDGMSDKEVKYYIMRSAKNAEVSEYRASSKAESNETAEGKPKEGKKIQAVDKTKQRQLTANNYKTLQDLHTLFEKKTGSALFTPTQIETLRVLGANRIVKLANGKEEVAPTLLEDAAKILGLKSKSSVSERVNAIQRRIQKKLGLTDEATNKLFDPKAKLTNEMKIELMDKIDEALEKLKEAEKDKPLVEPELTVPAPEKLQATGNRILDTMATVAKMERKADPVAVPKTDATTGHATVETGAAKPKESPSIVHPDPVADALVSGETNMTKTAVQLDIKKSFSMKGVFTQASDALDRLFNALAIEYPDEVVSLKTAKEQHAFVVKLLKEKGYDSVIDERGNVIPLKEPKVVGKTKKRISKEVAEKQQDPTVVTKEETTFSTEEGVPVVTTETVVATPKAPTGPVETPAGDRTVVPEPTKGVSDVAKLPEAETLERKVNEDPKLLRNNGMDRSFLKLFTKAYWKSKVEGAGKDTLTTKFKTAWGDFVQVNQFIAEANKRMFGEDIMERFWKKVDEINAVDRIRPKAAEGPTGIKPLTYREVLDKAAAAMNEEGKPAFVRPLLPEEIKFVKADEAGTVRLSAKNKKTHAIVDAALTEAEKVEPPPVEKAMDAEGKPLPEDTTPIKPEDPTPPKSNDQLIDSAIDAPEAAASRPWRLNNFVGHLFGGDNTANATWWRKMMARLANATQSSSQLGNTIRSFNDSIAFISRWADDTRAQTGHVVGVGKTPFKTMLQIKMDEGRVITRILRAYSDFDTTLRGANKPAVQAYIYDCLRKGEQPNKAEMAKLGVGVHNAEAAVKKATYLLEISRAINDKILYMENTTGRLVTTDKLGMPLDPKKYAPVQFDHEALMRIPPGEHSKVIDAMVIARTATKLNDPRLDKNTMIVMGWIDVKYNEKTGGYDFYSKEREIKHSEAVNMFGNDTLAKLQVSKIAKEGMGGNKSILKNMLRKGDPNKYFIIESDTEYTVYRLPEVLDELGNADKAKYLEAVKGNTAHYTIEWRERLGNKNLIQREMEEMFAYKTKKAPYGNDNYGLVRSMFKLDENGQSGITVHGLTPEEMLSDPMLAKLLRTNLAEAYFHWVKGRYFDLGFQQELDRVMGTKGINWEMVTNRVRERAQKDITKIAIDSGWTNKQLESATTDINNGIKRLQEEFRAGAETLPFFANKGTLGSRAANAAIRFKFSAGYGVSQFTEILQELVKHSPEFYKIPKNVFTALRYVVGDYRISKNKLLMSELGDMTFVLEAFKTDLSNRFMGETGYGTLTTDSRMGTRFAKVAQHIRDANGLGETLVTIGEGAAEGMQTLGSLSAQTQAVRVLGKVRMQRSIWHYFNNGSVEKLLTRLQDPKVAAELAELNKAAALDQTHQVKLWKRFAGVARESGFSMDQHDAMMFLKYGFGDPETVKAFKWAMSKVKHDNGRVNINLLWDLADQVAREGSKEVDPEVLGNALSNYQFMLEDRITKEVASEVRGLNRQTDLDSRSAFGRLWYALSSFTRSYQDNVIMGYGSKSSLKYLAGGIFLYMAVDALTSYLKEYLAGRDHKDILQELEDHPSEFMIRGAARTPFLGTWNGFLEAGLAGASYLNGGTYRYYGIPGLPAGASAGDAALSDMYNSTKTLVGSDSDMGKRLKAASGLLGVSDIVNRSHAAIPIRVLQDMGAIEQQSATGTYLDLIHRKPYPYMKQTASTSNYQPMNPNDYEPTPRNFAKEASEYEAARQMAKQFPLPPERVVVPKRTATGRGTTRQMFNSTSPNRGVSGELGDLLDQ